MGIPFISEASVTDPLRKIVGSMPNKRLAQAATYAGLLDPDRRRTTPTDSESIVWEDDCSGLGHFRRAIADDNNGYSPVPSDRTSWAGAKGLCGNG